MDLEDILEFFSGAAGAYSAYQGTDDKVAKPYFLPGQEAGYGTGIGAAIADFAQGPDQYYPGQTVADLDPNVIAGQNDRLASMDRLQGMADQGGIAAQRLAQGGAGLVGGFDLQDQIGFGIPQEYQQAIMNPIMKQLSEKVIPGLHTAATAQGAFGGSRMNQQKADAATQATEAATDAMIRGNLQARQQSIGQRAGDISALLGGRQQDINQFANMNNAMANGVNAVTTGMAQQTLPGQMQSDIGKERQAYEQGLINADMDRFAFNRNEGNAYIDRLFNRMSLAPQMSGGTVQGQSGDWADAFLGYNTGRNIYNNALGTAPVTNTTQQQPKPTAP